MLCKLTRVILPYLQKDASKHILNSIKETWLPISIHFLNDNFFIFFLTIDKHATICNSLNRTGFRAIVSERG